MKGDPTMKISRQSSVSIILPANPTTREVFSAEELSKYWKKIFPGIAVEITDESKKAEGYRILIGGPEHNKASAALISEDAFRKTVPGPEGMMIKAFGEDALLLAGSSWNPNECERGTLYAVYELLERFMGCSFGAYVDPDIAGGEYIPELDSCDLNGIEFIKASADNTYRTAIMEYNNEAMPVDHIHNRNLIDWLAKNRYNRMLFWTRTYEQYKNVPGLLDEVDKRGFRLTVGHHSAIHMFLPALGNEYFPEEYFNTHPEYYKLEENGERFDAITSLTTFRGQWILCSRNTELAEQISKNIIHWISENPTVDTIAFWPLDRESDNCCCPKCAKFSKVENYTYFQNEVARRVGAVHPDVKIDMIAYKDLWDCPEGLVLEKNLFVDESTWHISTLRNIGKPDGSCLTSTFFEDDLLKWKKAGASVVYYDYYMGVHMARQRYIPAADEIQSLAKRFKEVGIDGTGTQIEYYNFWNHIFNFYTLARTNYDNRLSMDDNLDRFCRIFGEGAPYVSKIIHTTEACLDGQVSIELAALYLMDTMDTAPVYELFDEAFFAAKTPAARNNLRMFRMAFRYSDLECHHIPEGVKRHKSAPLDPTGELKYINTHFDSFQYNNPGFAIMLLKACDSDAEFTPNHWYEFEPK